MRTAAVLALGFIAACATSTNPPAPAPAPEPKKEEPKKEEAKKEEAKKAEPFVLDDVIFFPPDVATPGPQISAQLEAVASKLRDRPDVRIEIAGHCNDKEMVEVAYARANLVASGLAARGVPRTRVFVETYGNLRPLAPNTSDEGRAKNRRVDFKVLAP